MNLITPFSGLSLIVHILIIAFIKLFAFVRRRIHFINFEKIIRSKEFVFRFVNNAHISIALSLLIITIVVSFVSFSTYFAIKTGIREGENEVHRKYFATRYEFLKNNNFTFKSPVITLFHNNFR